MSMAARPSQPKPEMARSTHSKPGEAQRNEPENRSKGKDFKERLEKLSQSEVPETKGKSEEGAKAAHPKGPVKGKAGQEERERDDSNSGSGGGQAISTQHDFAKSLALAAVTKPETLPNEQLARIVAALEELIDKGGSAEYKLTLPAGATMVEGAVIGRDPTGKLNVQLLANAAIPAAAIQQLQSALRMKLANRKAELGKLGVSYGRSAKG